MNKHSHLIVLLGTPTADASRLYAMTVTEGDPAWAGALSGIALGLTVYHVTEPAVKQQIVEASLKDFGVPIEKIIEAGVQEIQALQAYIQTGAQDTQKVLEESQRRIAQYEEEVRRIKIVMDQRVQEQQAVMKACNDRKLGIQRVLEFFGQEVVARVVRDSPKLIDPSERKA